MGKQTGSIDLRTIYVAGKDAEAISEAKAYGTINYIRNGNFNNGSEYWSAGTQIGVDSKGNNCAVGSASQRRDDFVDTPLALKQGDKITLSFIAEHSNVSGSLSIFIDISDEGLHPWRYLEEVWQGAAGIPLDRVSRSRIVETFTLDRDADYLVVGIAGGSGSNVKITNVQVEKGETATDFSLNNGDAEIAAAEVAKQIPKKTSDLINDSGFVNKTDILDIFYPIGSYYETSDTDFDPNTAWGGTWVLEAEGLAHISAGNNYVAGNNYGANDVTLEKGNIPRFTGAVNLASNIARNNITNPPLIEAASGVLSRAQRTGRNAVKVATTTIANSQTIYDTINLALGSENPSAVSVMQESVAVNRWHRTE